MDDKYWFLKQCDLFERLTSEQIARIESQSRTRKFPRGSLIYAPSDSGNSVLLLITGRVKIHHLTADGKQALLALIDPGELFGELALLEGGQREEFAEAMTATQIISIPRELVQQLMEEHSAVSIGVTKLLGFRRLRLERRLKSLLFRSNRERLIHLIVELMEKYGEQTPDGTLISIRLSHQELANIIGSTRETVTVQLGELQSEGCVKVIKRRIYVPNPIALAELIGLAAPKIPIPNPHGRSDPNPARVRNYN